MRALMLLLILTACATPARDERDDVFQAHLAGLSEQMAAGTMTRRQAAASARDKAAELFNDPQMTELWSYRVMLAEQVEKGETTVAQAEYLDQRKVNEIMERQKSSPQPIRTYQPAVTCRPDGYGAVRCR